ncbi:potassium channel subfamily K member 10-like [Branchiostoma floridae x Branchiostoma belcheri]
MKKTTLLALAVAFLGYLFIGGGVFHVLESPHEKTVRENTFKVQKEQQEHFEWMFDDDYFDNATKKAWNNQDLPLTEDKVRKLVQKAKIYLDKAVQNLTWETYEWHGSNNTTTTVNTIKRRHLPIIILSEHELYEIMESVLEASESGLDPFSDETDSSPPNWDFMPSIGFSMTVVTTIGYGATTPKTTGGRVFTIFYALLGIPLTAAFLSGIAGGMSEVVRKVTNAIQKRHPKCTPATASHIAWTFCLILGCGVFLALPAYVVHYVEQWTFLESVYFMFVSLSTIGFGDFVTGIQKKIYWEGYRILTQIWILVGLAFLATIFDLISQAIKKVEDRIEEETEMEGGEETTGEENLGEDAEEKEEKTSDGDNKKEPQERAVEEEAMGGSETPVVSPRQNSTRRPRVPLIMIVDNPGAQERQAKQHV